MDGSGALVILVNDGLSAFFGVFLVLVCGSKVMNSVQRQKGACVLDESQTDGDWQAVEDVEGFHHKGYDIHGKSDEDKDLFFLFGCHDCSLLKQ